MVRCSVALAFFVVVGQAVAGEEGTVIDLQVGGPMRIIKAANAEIPSMELDPSADPSSQGIDGKTTFSSFRKEKTRCADALAFCDSAPKVSLENDMMPGFDRPQSKGASPNDEGFAAGMGFLPELRGSALSYGLTHSISLGFGYDFIEAEDLVDHMLMITAEDAAYASHRILIRARLSLD